MNKYSLLAYIISFVIVIAVTFWLTDRDTTVKVAAALASAVAIQQVVKAASEKSKKVDQMKQKLQTPSTPSMPTESVQPELEQTETPDQELFERQPNDQSSQYVQFSQVTNNQNQ